MGYTHHWEVAESISDSRWNQFCSDCRKIFKATKVKLGRDWESREKRSKPEITDTFVFFNGVGDDALEDFYVSRDNPNYAFCKTIRLPYDVVVVACWLAGWENHIFSGVNSDGDFDEENPFLEGKELYERATKTMLKRKQPTREGRNHPVVTAKRGKK